MTITSREMKRAKWDTLTRAQKIITVALALPKSRKLVRAWDVAFKLGIDTTTARKYLRLAVLAGHCRCEPHERERYLGAREREYGRTLR